jgi:hypothetical protein
MALAPVVLTTFISVPMNLGRHPGDQLVRVVTTGGHMT